MDYFVSAKSPKILIIKMSALGDVVMTLPTLWALREHYPGAQIDWLVEKPASGILMGHPALNRIIISPRHKVSRLFKAGRWLAAQAVLRASRREIRSVKYDIILDLQGLAKSALKVWLARGVRKIGYDRTREQAHRFLNEKIPAYDPEVHASWRYLEAAAYLGAEPHPHYGQHLQNITAGNFTASFAPYYQAPPTAQEAAVALLTPLLSSYEERAFVVLNPGAKWVTKRWPKEHWAQLAGSLAAKGIPLVVTGGRDDAPWAEAISSAAPKALNLCGQTSVPTLAVVLEKASAVVTADTGPMHLAAAVGSGGLALFGPTRPHRTGPFGGNFKILTPKLPCLGCLKKKCELPCLAELQPQTVETELLAYLAELRPQTVKTELLAYLREH